MGSIAMELCMVAFGRRCSAIKTEFGALTERFVENLGDSHKNGESWQVHRNEN